MTERRGPLTYTGAALIIGGVVLCAISLAVTSSDREAVWSVLISRQKVALVIVLVAAAGFAIAAMAASARLPRALAAVCAGVGVGWFLAWNIYGVSDGDTSAYVAIAGSLLLLAGAVLSGFAASGAEDAPAPEFAGGGLSSPAMAAAATPGLSATPAGWYPDPSAPGALRYWDGSAWTEHVAPG